MSKIDYLCQFCCVRKGLLWCYHTKSLRETPGKSIGPQLVSCSCTSIEKQGSHVKFLYIILKANKPETVVKILKSPWIQLISEIGPLNGSVVGALGKPCMMLLLFGKQGIVREISALKKTSPSTGQVYSVAIVLKDGAITTFCLFIEGLRKPQNHCLPESQCLLGWVPGWICTILRPG